MKISKKYDVVILGGGAAGLFCAFHAGRRGRSVLVLERNDKVAKKIRISGGGRCNFTNLNVSAENFISNNHHFCKSALSRYSSEEFINLIRSHEIEYFEKEKGQLFCKKNADDIISFLKKECSKSHVEIQTNIETKEIHKKELFEVSTSLGVIRGESLVIATGGPSFPGIGATDFGFLIAQKFGLKTIKFEAALVPLKAVDAFLDLCRELSGLSLEIRIKNSKYQEIDSLLFTHRGLSGPGILQTSLFWKAKDSLIIDFLPHILKEDLELWREREGKNNFHTKLRKFLPKKFIENWFSFHDLPLFQKFAEIKKEKYQEIVDSLKNYLFLPHSTEGLKKAEVCRGGVSTDEISSKSMESKKIPKLFFIGEVLDVTGQLGGYNFQWAWASAKAASEFV